MVPTRIRKRSGAWTLNKLPLDRSKSCTRAAMRSVRATLACALVLAGVASISTMPVRKEHKNSDDIPNSATAPKTAITIPCAMVPFAQCTVDAGCKLDKGGKCVVNPAAPPVNCRAVCRPPEPRLQPLWGSQPWRSLEP